MKLTEAMVVAARGTHNHMEINPEEFRAVTTEDIIDGFLSVGEYRINPDETTTEEDIAVQSAVEDEEIISEELARIYQMQGLTDKAQEIYNKLQQREQSQSE